MIPGLDNAINVQLDDPGTFEVALASRVPDTTTAFRVPYFAQYMDVELWGSGGVAYTTITPNKDSVGVTYGYSFSGGYAGRPSTFNGMSAGNPVASGGDVNTNGGNNSGYNGGAAANGGPGVGGAGTTRTINYGGEDRVSGVQGRPGGSYSKKRFTAATITQGAFYNIVLGMGNGGAKAKITWA